MIFAITDIFGIFNYVFNGIMRAFDVIIPGFPISISHIWLGLFLLAIIVTIFSKKKEK